MKLFCALLAFWTLTLSIQPCSDDCHQAEQASEATHSHEDSSSEGICSPFCVCSTCPGFVPQPGPLAAVLVELLDLRPEAPRHFFRLAALPEGLRRFWQPPKV